MPSCFHIVTLAGVVVTIAEICGIVSCSGVAGEFSIGTNTAGNLRIEVRSWPVTGRIDLTAPFPNVTAAYLVDRGRRSSLNWSHDAQAGKLEVELPAQPPTKMPAEVLLETTEKTEQFPDGRITFSALDAKWEGDSLQRESPPGDYRITSWTNSAPEWDFSPTRWGSYELELAYAAEIGAGTKAEVDVAGERSTLPLPSTGGSWRYGVISLGRVYLAKADAFKLRLRCVGLEDKAGMNFKALTLRPAPEGKSVVQDAKGTVTMAARDATTHSIQMRYEPAEIKNCLGYWVNPADWADWEFKVTQPGTFEIEVWQGCGQGQGGSDVAVEVRGERFNFVVEETGHFQIFLPRRLGRVQLPIAGTYSLAIKPQRKQAGAIMDVRQVRLLPVGPSAPQVRQFPGKRSLWYGFERFDFEVDGKPVLVVAPKHEAPGRPWAWHGEFFGHKPNPDLALLGRGFHIVYMSVPDMLGSPEAVAHWNVLYEELTGEFGFAKKAALVGLSRGGLYVYNWATANPQRVACIYGDAPVCDFKSWPGAFGKGKRSDRDWQLVLERYGFKSEAEAKAYGKNPVDNLQPLAAAKVPLLHVYGDADEVVPWDENTGVVAERYRKLGGNITLIAKPGVQHHPHGLDDSTPIVEFIWQHAASPEAKAWLARHGGGPMDAGERPLIRKLGTIDLDLVETTPVVFNGRLYRFEWVREGYWNNQRKTNYFQFIDHENGEVLPPFADGHEFGSAFVHDQTLYVTGTRGRGAVDVFSSRDLKNWESWPAIADGRYGIFNTSVCQAGEEFVLMFEIDRPAEEAGTPFTARFAKSRDLRTWTITPPECNYAKDRYTAPHCLRWLEGWFYDFYLEAHDGYEMRVVRSRDLEKWEPSPLNPVLRASAEDKVIANAKLDGDQRARIAHAVNLNNSDIDFCQWQSRLLINYSWGNQQGVEHLAEAIYDGTEAQFLRGWFPEKR